MGTADAARTRLKDDLALVAAGDRAAFARVYAVTSHKLFGIVLRLVQDREAAEDVLQDVYLKIWDGAGDFAADRGSPIAWMASIARYSAIDSLRRRDRRREDGEPPETADTAVSGDPDLRIGLTRCMNLLEEHQRHSIRSAFFDGYSYAELAHNAAVPLGTMKSWIRRGLERLRFSLDADRP
jgi:RNA polymerase sigma-70 factor (ECF subfamily)